MRIISEGKKVHLFLIPRIYLYSFDHVVIQLQTAVFSHGELYVALSRSRNACQERVFIEPHTQQGPLNDNRQFTRIIVLSSAGLNY